MKKFLVILFILLFQNFPSFGEWKKVTEGVRNDIFYIDFDKVKKIKGEIYYWTLINFDKRNKFGFFSITNYRKVDCKNLRYWGLKVFFYTEKMGNGIKKPGLIPNKWSNVSPGSVHEFKLKLICEKYS